MSVLDTIRKLLNTPIASGNSPLGNAVTYLNNAASRVYNPQNWVEPFKETFQPAGQYISDTAKLATEAAQGLVELTPAYQSYLGVTGKPISPVQYSKTALNTVLNGLNAAWRVQPAAPLIGAGLQSWGDIRRYFGGNLTTDELLKAPMKGINSQPGFGQVITDDPKQQAIIDLVSMAGIIAQPYISKKLNNLNLNSEELNQISNILGVKPNSPLEEINFAWKKEVTKYPDVFVGKGTELGKQRVNELNNAYNILKNTNAFDRNYARVYSFLSKFNPDLGLSIKPVTRQLPSNEAKTNAITKYAEDLGYQKGTIKKLEDRIDSLLGFDFGNITGNWKSDYYARQELLSDSSLESMGAPSYVVDEVKQLRDTIERLQEIKNTQAFKQGAEGKTTLEGLLTESPAQTAFRREANLTPQESYKAKVQKIIKSWEDAVTFDVNENTKRLQTFEREQSGLNSEMGIKPYKPTPETLRNFPSQELSGFNSKDKAAFSYQRETLARNIEDTFKNPKDADAIKKYFYEPIVKNETDNITFQNDLKTQIRTSFNDNSIKKGSNEDYAAADYIEGKLSKEDLQQKFPQKWQGIVEVADEGRAIYKGLLTRINQEITKFGYEPIPERQNYVTHTQEIQTFMDVLGNLTNLSSDKLPTAMSSIHLTTKPGRAWFRFRLHRVGESTHEGLMTALEKYIPPAGNQIFHTGDIQRGRAIEAYLQKQNEGTQYQNLSNFESYISQYVDSLAGKQNILDRPIEKLFGRKLLNLGDSLKQRVGANMTGANLSSALTNFIPFTQSLATTSKPAALKGLYKAVLSPAEGLTNVDGVQSSFLTRRFPEGDIASSISSKAKNAAYSLFKIVDGFTAKSVVAGKYYDWLSKGFSKEESMKLADEFAARVLADRSYGQVPLLFKSKTLGAFTQFQVEVNNQLSFLLKDIPKNFGYSKKQIASALVQFIIYSYLYNELSERITGRRSQIDILHAGLLAYQKTKAQEDWKDIVNPTNQNTPVGEIAYNLPFNPFSIASGGRIPLGSAIPNPLNIASGESTPIEEMKKLVYLVPPTGGGQIKKTVEGLQAYKQGAVTTPSGNVKFPVEQGTLPLIQNLLFGQYSGANARNYYRGNQSPLGDNQSLLYGILGKDYYNDVVAQRESKRQALIRLKQSELYKEASPELRKVFESKIQ